MVKENSSYFHRIITAKKELHSRSSQVEVISHDGISLTDDRDTEDKIREFPPTTFYQKGQQRASSPLELESYFIGTRGLGCLLQRALLWGLWQEKNKRIFKSTDTFTFSTFVQYS